MKVLFDLNVILDVMEHRPEFVRESALSIGKVVSAKGGEACMAVHAVSTAFYIMRKHLGPDAAHLALKKMLGVFTVLQESRSVQVAALDVPTPDYEDAVSFLAAASSGCDCIVTRNPKDFAASPVKVFTPAQFLASFQR